MANELSLPALSGAQRICDWLVQHGVRRVFLVPGAQLHPLMRALARKPGLSAIVASHEQGAAFAADGYARASGEPGVCLSIASPGASNMLTAALAARQGGVPLLFITGDVPSEGRDAGAFQGAGARDQKLFAIAVDHAWHIDDPARLEPTLDEAWGVMAAGGTCHVAVPIDIQTHAVRSGTAVAQPYPVIDSTLHACRGLAEALGRYPNALLWVGPRLASVAGAAALQGFAEAFRLPVVTTLSAKGLLPEQHPLSHGNFGFAGTPQACTTMLEGDHDLLLVVGVDFNERDSLLWDPRIRRHRHIVRVDTPVHRQESDLHADASYWCADLPRLLRRVTRRVDVNAIRAAPPRSPLVHQNPPFSTREGGALTLAEVVRTLRAILPDEAVLVADAGMVRIFAAQLWQARRPLTFFSDAALATMGWAIGAGIGVKLARPADPVVVLTGDGCMLMHGNEVATAARYGIKVVFIVANNSGYGSILRRAGDDPGTQDLARSPSVDWEGYARALGVRAMTARSRAQLETALQEAADHDGPLLIHVPTLPDEPYPYPDAVKSALTPYFSKGGR